MGFGESESAIGDGGTGERRFSIPFASRDRRRAGRFDEGEFLRSYGLVAVGYLRIVRAIAFGDRFSPRRRIALGVNRRAVSGEGFSRRSSAIGESGFGDRYRRFRFVVPYRRRESFCSFGTTRERTRFGGFCFGDAFRRNEIARIRRRIGRAARVRAGGEYPVVFFARCFRERCRGRRSSPSFAVAMDSEKNDRRIFGLCGHNFFERKIPTTERRIFGSDNVTLLSR